MLRCPIYATPFTAILIEGKLEEAGLSDRARVTRVPLSGHLVLGPFAIDFISISHSIPESNALSISTPLGTVLHTGDWKIDDTPVVGESTDAKTLVDLGDKGVLALVCDSTNALLEGRSGSEESVRSSLTELIGSRSGRIAVTCFASNVARLATIAEAAQKHGRQVALVGRSMYKIVEAARDSGYLTSFPETVDEETAAQLPPRRVLYLCTGSQGETRAALARIATNDHPNVKLGPGDAVIFSSRIIPGNELAIFDLHNALAKLGVEVLSAEEYHVHVSGHPSREELSDMYRWTRPRIAVPVHGELRHMSEHARLARSLQVPQAVVVENGQMLRLAPGPAEIIDEIRSGRLHLDGRLLIEESAGLSRARRALGAAGMLAITIVLDARGRVAGEPAVISEGIPESVREAARAAVDTVLRGHKPGRTADEDLKEAVRRSARRAASDLWGKKPPTRVEIVSL
jgi:ribonuclease J